ncbi:O-antigen ligase family protein [Arthrobacter sp. E3]|uniref:O-antigen ligase family protein n=1 Tax=Arthrobacter sp. E3 TaxID=517402 RepID=UPI001A94892D|nr:O-antigen ligase family protein [Arthrobacter sp. E3]
MLLLLFAILLLAIAVIVFQSGVFKGALFILIMVLFMAPFGLTQVSSTSHVGVAQGQPQLTLPLLLAVIFAGIFIVRQRKNTGVRLIAIPIIYLILAWVLIWQHSATVNAGFIHYLGGGVVWFVGYTIAKYRQADVTWDRHISVAIFAVLLLEFVVVSAQMMGLSVGVFGEAQVAGNIMRPGGTFGHPGNLGKALLLILPFVFQFVRSADVLARRVSKCSLSLVILMTALTFGRANMIGVVIAVLLWIVLNKNKNGLDAKFKSIFLLILICLPFFSIYLLRFEDDPTGGERPELQSEALMQISQNLWGGTGPNNYVEVVGRWASSTSAGFPVHNAFLLLVAEMGVIGALSFLFPFVVVVILSLRSLSSSRATVESPMIYFVAIIPGIIIAAASGWGLLSGNVYLLACIVFSYTAGSWARDRHSFRANAKSSVVV